MKKILFLIGSFTCLCTHQIFAIITGLSCLYNPQTGMRIAILYDIHAAQMARTELKGIESPKLEDIEAILKSQKEELEQLVEVVSKDQGESVLFLIECTSLRRGEIRLGDLDQIPDILAVIPKIFLKQETDKIGNAQFNCSDPRSHVDIFAATNFVSGFDTLKKALEEGTLDQTVAEITIEFYQNHMQKTYDEVLKKINAISFLTPESKEVVKKSAEQAYSKVVDFMDEVIKKHQLKMNAHLLDLYDTQLKVGNYYLFSRIADWGSVQFDVELLDYIDYIQAKHITTTVVVQAGGLHAKLLEHRLLQHGFELVSSYGNTETYSVDENDYVTQKKPTAEELTTGLTNLDQLVLNCLKDHAKTEISQNFLIGLWNTIKGWFGY